MRVFVNNQEVEIIPGMTVRHALISAGFQGMLSEEVRVTDEWGNSIGMNGALDEGAKIIVRKGSKTTTPKDKDCHARSTRGQTASKGRPTRTNDGD